MRVRRVGHRAGRTSAVKVEGDQSYVPVVGQLLRASRSRRIQAAVPPRPHLRYPMKRTNPKGEESRLGAHHLGRGHGRPSARSSTRSSSKYGGQSIFNMCGTSRQWVYGALRRSTSGCFGHSQRPCRPPRSARARVASCGCDQLGRTAPPWMALRDGPRVYVQWGTASGVLELRRQLPQPSWTASSAADTHICVDPRLSGSGKEADYWLNLRAGHRRRAGAGLAARSSSRTTLIDWEFVKRWTERVRSSWWRTWSPRAAATSNCPSPIAGSTASARRGSISARS